MVIVALACESQSSGKDGFLPEKAMIIHCHTCAIV